MKRGKITPFKLLAYIEHAGVQGSVYNVAGDPSKLFLQLTPIVKALKTNSTDVRKDLIWLRDKGYLTHLYLGWGKAIISVYNPPRLSLSMEEVGRRMSPTSSFEVSPQ